MALEQARTRQRLLNFLNGGVSTVVSLARIQRVLALAQRNLHQQTILTLYPMTLLVQRQDGAYRMHQGVFNARSTRVFVDIGDVLSHPQLVQRLLRAAPPESLLFNLVANVSAVYAILVGEDFAFDPVTQVARRRLYIKYGRSVNVPSRLRDHQAVCGHAELLFMLPVPKEELRVEIVRVWVKDVDDILRVFYDLHE
ncbi:hypothetical protein PHYBOEH_008444 [Phytophthora boehmeriae]|uniref:Uncharacterized protein n=1 Tax=Phytophthora boehmeriae TaxID=109152 RepID=A0A8T1W4E7_9STRA|nr:hypothetical protein PHYBOEH_008444 [Phytophthora boehmeriae]